MEFLSKMTEKFNIHSDDLSTIYKDKTVHKAPIDIGSLYNVSSYLEDSKSSYAKLKK